MSRRTVFAMPFIVTAACRHPGGPAAPLAYEEPEASGGELGAPRDAAAVVADAGPGDAPAGPKAARFRVDALQPIETEVDYQRKCAAGVYHCSPIPPGEAGPPAAFDAEIHAIAASGAGGSRVRFARDPRIDGARWIAAIDGHPCTIVEIGAWEVECTMAIDAAALDADHVTLAPTRSSIEAYYRAECAKPTVHCNPPHPTWEAVRVIGIEVTSGGVRLATAKPKWVQLGAAGAKCRLPERPAVSCEVVRVGERQLVIAIDGVTPDQIKVVGEIEVQP